ncbi:MAG: DUF58 domain-containing protein [Blastochloris sp.]|nr:DUF58 domain-containing protein [Blastochloris sp.]
MADAKSKSNYLDPKALAKGEALGILARKVVEGYRVGEHRSPFKGFAIEFAQHREYTIGDDMRHLDWKVLGRTDRYYIKQYEQDTNFVANIFVDGSESMTYGSDEKMSKFEYGRRLAACLAYLVLLQRDAVALGIFDSEGSDYSPRTDSLGKIHTIMHRLANYEPSKTTGLGEALKRLSMNVKSKGIVIIISDLMDESLDFQRAVEQIRFSGSEVIVFQVLDPYEIKFPLTGTVEFRGLEGQATLTTSPADLKKSYLEEFGKFLKETRLVCERSASHYSLVDTSVSLAENLSAYLVFRHQVGKGR